MNEELKKRLLEAVDILEEAQDYSTNEQYNRIDKLVEEIYKIIDNRT